MIEHNVSVYKGGTSQPAVMNLGYLMKRPLFSWVLRKETAFHSTHFNPYLPTSLRSMEQSSLSSMSLKPD